MDTSDETISHSSVARPSLIQRTIYINQPQSRTYYSNKIRYSLLSFCARRNGL